MNIGAHISIAGGIINAPKRAFDLNCQAMQIFTRSPQGGKSPELTKEICQEFKNLIIKHKIKNTYIHTPYYINFASIKNSICYGSVNIVRDELERGNLINAKYVVTHLGSAKDLEQKEAIEKVIEMLKKILKNYEGKTKLLLENSAGSGKIIGSSLRDLKTIINEVKNKALAGICLDTQHAFVSGYNWIDFEKTLALIDQEIGLEKIKLIHINDSKTDLNSKKDRHEHIGLGKIGKKAFQKIVFFAKKNSLDLILETEPNGIHEDIQFLKFFQK